jgi:hypothetical protein
MLPAARLVLIALLMLMSTTAQADDPVVVSPAPEKVGITIYRDPNRTGADAMNLDYLNSFALITETRTVDIPPGVVTIRLEGVASGIIPQSAMILGAPVGEKNRDSALLSQRGLLDAFTGQRVILKRTDPATGKTVEESATIRSAPDRVIVQTARGFEAMYCSGLNQTLLFGGVPRTLSATPVLSMTTKLQEGGRRTITLAYLARNFDWNANYIGQLSPDATEMSLFSWLTMASGDDTSFADAQAAAVAGKVNRVEGGEDDESSDSPYLNRSYGCWPMATTSTDQPAPPPPAAFLGGMAPVMMEMEYRSADAARGEIAVTGSRIAVREDLGDLKLYSIPFPVTVAARSQKQVAFLSKPKVKGKMLYRVSMQYGDPGDVELLFRFHNTVENGIGEPLPAGRVALFQDAAGRRMLVGEARIDDKTLNEDVDLVFGEASNVTVEDVEIRDGGRWEECRLTVRNANPFPIQFEAEFQNDENTSYGQFSGKILKRRGKLVWVATIGANGTAILDYRKSDIDAPKEAEK